MDQNVRENLLKAAAVLFGLLAISNFSKPLAANEHQGFVLLGQRLTGTPNMIFGPLFGLYLATYAHAIWTRKPYALWMGSIYAAYVAANLVLWTMRMPAGAESSLAFGLAYTAIALGVSWGAVYLLFKRG